MKRTSVRLALALLGLAVWPIGTARGQCWWERGADTWYYKDDWKGLALTDTRGGRRPGVTKTLRAAGGARSGWIVVWGARGYGLVVNGRKVGSSVDGCLIDDYDLMSFVAGAEAVTLRIEGRGVCAEGEIVAADGKVVGFATGADWQGSGGSRPKAEKLRPGPSHGAFHRAHNGRLMTYSAEERGKAAIAKALARIQRLAEQGVFLLRRLRPAGEILSFDADAPWRRAEALAGPLAAEARTVLVTKAIPAQKAGRFAEAIAAANEAARLLAAAEAAVEAATEIYRAEREAAHLAGLTAILGMEDALADDLGGLRRLAASARRACGLGDASSARKAVRRGREQAAGLRVRIAAEAATAGRALLGGVGRLDGFAEDRFAWLNARKLMANDPLNWPFSMLPSDAPHVSLNGRWHFRTDPANVGEKRGWPSGPLGDRWRTVFAPRPWEREGFTEDHRAAPGAPIGKGTTGRDKPYNGFAWYRKTLHVPVSWRGRKVVLQVGQVANWGQVFVNGKAVGLVPQTAGGRRLSPPATVEIPPGAIAFGKPNAIAVRVYNHDNFGGIVSGPLAIHAAGARPELRETPGPMSLVQEYVHARWAEARRQTFLAGAMSPMVLVAHERPTLELWGWEAKGFAPPDAVVLPTKGGRRTIALGAEADLLPQTGLAGEWIHLRGREVNVLIVPERKLAALTWRRNAQGSMGLTLRFGAGPARAAVLSLPAGTRLSEKACGLWVRAARQYPVSASECVFAVKGGGDARLQRCTIRYNYLAFGGRGRRFDPLAPVPMLAAYARKHKHPHLSVGRAVETGYASPYAPYLVVEDADTLTYTSSAVDRAKVMKGVGELFARKSAARNVHGGLGEREMFRRQAEWGFDHNRYALAFGADWDLPLVKRIGGPITDDEQLWKRLDELVANCSDAGMQMMLCSFPEIESRKWKDNPQLQANAFEFWRRIAKRYAHLPDWAISYDPFNEPAYMNRDHWNEVMRELTRIIRSADKRHTIVWESADGWAQPHWCLWMQPVADDNVLYSFHHYGKHWGYAYDEYYPGYQRTFERTQVDAWLEAILFGLRHHVPIHCGEFGLSMIQPAGDGEKWLDDYLGLFERFGIGWNWWNYSGDNIYRTGLAAGDRISPYVPILRKWMARSGWGKARRAER